MQCENCQQNDATIHLTEIVEGVRTEMHLCERCAQEQGIVVKTQIPINELLSGLLASQSGDEGIFGEQDKKISCPHCGFTMEQYRKDAVLGCPYDYDVFEKSLLPLIKKAHDDKTTHCGKVPSKIPVDAKKQLELLNLRKQLEIAVQNEDYETAAKLRDKINQME
jgi:protein arginine kinase activator